MQSYSRDDLLALTAERYLADGYLAPDGTMRRELTGTFATAVCTQFLAAELSPQELALTAEAVRQIMALQTGTPAENARAATAEALVLVANSIRQRNNEVLAKWFLECAGAVRTAADLQAYLAHVLAVERQYGLVASLSLQHSSPPPE